VIDLRSDTVTKPTVEMRHAMANAEVGDDVLCEDPTVNRLERQVAELLGMEAALFVPSGTMGNQLGVRVHCGPGDEFLCEAQCHIHYYEQAAHAQLFGVATHTLVTPAGLPTVEQVKLAIRKDDLHYARTKLLCLENTHNRHGGVVLDFAETEKVCAAAADAGLARHLDGARLWNACAATGRSPAELCQHFDTVSVCFSKGLGAPIGSALAGPAELIAQARRTRKALGGGVRQAGIIAAGALYALEHHLPKLGEDHQKAEALRSVIEKIGGLTLPNRTGANTPTLTNLVYFDVDPSLGTAAEFAAKLKEAGVLMYDIGPQRLRAVTHLGLTMEDVERAGEVLTQL